MAAGDITVSDGTPICWADTTDYSSTNSGISRTHQIDLTSLADGGARQSVKADLGATRAPSYAVKVCIEFDVAPTAGEKVWILWSSSISATAGTGNDGDDADGADGSWDPGSGAEDDRQEHMHHLSILGTLTAANDAAPTHQTAMINKSFRPPSRYGFPIVFNQSGQAFEGDAVEMFIALIPLNENVAAS